MCLTPIAGVLGVRYRGQEQTVHTVACICSYWCQMSPNRDTICTVSEQRWSCKSRATRWVLMFARVYAREEENRAHVTMKSQRHRTTEGFTTLLIPRPTYRFRRPARLELLSLLRVMHTASPETMSTLYTACLLAALFTRHCCTV